MLRETRIARCDAGTEVAGETHLSLLGQCLSLQGRARRSRSRMFRLYPRAVCTPVRFVGPSSATHSHLAKRLAWLVARTPSVRWPPARATERSDGDDGDGGSALRRVRERESPLNETTTAPPDDKARQQDGARRRRRRRDAAPPTKCVSHQHARTPPLGQHTASLLFSASTLYHCANQHRSTVIEAPPHCHYYSYRLLSPSTPPLSRICIVVVVAVVVTAATADYYRHRPARTTTFLKLSTLHDPELFPCTCFTQAVPFTRVSSMFVSYVAVFTIRCGDTSSIFEAARAISADFYDRVSSLLSVSVLLALLFLLPLVVGVLLPRCGYYHRRSVVNRAPPHTAMRDRVQTQPPRDGKRSVISAAARLAEPSAGQTSKTAGDCNTPAAIKLRRHRL